MVASILGFVALALAVVIMPGADTILVLRTSLRSGARAAFITAAGIVCGPVLWGALAGLGVALVLARAPIVYSAVAVAGAAYLVSLATGSLRAACGLWQRRRQPAVADPPVGPTLAPRSHFMTGLVTNVLNPKIGVFYLSVMPGLFAPGDVTAWLGALLGALHGGLGLVYLSGVATFAAYMRRFLTRPAANAIVEFVCGLCLLVFAAFVVVETFTTIAR